MHENNETWEDIAEIIVFHEKQKDPQLALRFKIQKVQQLPAGIVRYGPILLLNFIIFL
jgi:hypothetical protein